MVGVWYRAVTAWRDGRVAAQKVISESPKNIPILAAHKMILLKALVGLQNCRIVFLLSGVEP
jgi:hypothetical protein